MREIRIGSINITSRNSSTCVPWQPSLPMPPGCGAPLQGPLAGPETERLLEGVAFLTGLIHEKLEDEFPEFVQGLMDIIFPFYLRPVPSISIVAFSSKPGFERPFPFPQEQDSRRSLSTVHRAGSGHVLTSRPIPSRCCMWAPRQRGINWLRSTWP